MESSRLPLAALRAAMAWSCEKPSSVILLMGVLRLLRGSRRHGGSCGRGIIRSTKWRNNSLLGFLLDSAGPSSNICALRFYYDGLAYVFSEALGDICFAEERDFSRGCVSGDDQRSFPEVDHHPVPLKHVEAEQEIDALAFHDCEAREEEHVTDFYGGGMDAAKDGGCSDTLGHTAVTSVDKTHDIACFGAGGGHDCFLGA
jgi:hypothetical protein